METDYRPGFSILSLMDLGIGVCFAPDPQPAPANTDPSTDEETEEEEPEFTEAQKKWMEKQEEKRKKEANETADQLAARLKEELRLEQEKTRKTEQRKAATDKAKAENNTTEVLRLKEEEKEAERIEKEEAKAELAKERAINAKLALVQKYKLPAGYEHRILGADQAAWEIDAAELAKNIPSTAARPRMDGGAKETSTKEAQTASSKKTATTLTSIF